MDIERMSRECGGELKRKKEMHRVGIEEEMAGW